MIRLILVFTLAASAFCDVLADAAWNAAVSGDWRTDSNWAGSVAPSSEGRTYITADDNGYTVTLGPGTIGALLEMGAKEGVNLSTRINDCLAIAVASAILFSVLFFADSLAKLLKGKGIVIVTKLTGMYLVALAAEIIFTGIKGFLHI